MCHTRKFLISGLAVAPLLLAGCGDDGPVDVDTGPDVAATAVVSGDGQVRFQETALVEALVVEGRDAGGSAVRESGIPVTWAVLSGGGTVDGTPQTSSAGEAMATWTLGPTLGEQRIRVQVGEGTPAEVVARAVEPGPIAFFSRLGGVRGPDGEGSPEGVFVMNPDGSDVAPVELEAGVGPAWAPDGSTIVFLREVDDATTQLFSVSMMDLEVTQLTSLPAPDERGLVHQPPTFSPDGGTIAYAIKQGDPDCDLAYTNIFVANPDGSGATKLTDGCGLANRDPVFSPDGARIAFTSKEGEASVGDPSDGTSSIFVMNADGSNAVRITDLGTDEGAPRWSPDGSRIYYQKEGTEIWSVNPDGTGEEHLWTPDAPPFVIQGVSPDGTRLLLDFVGSGEDFARLATLDLATGEVEEIYHLGLDGTWRSGG